MYKNPFLESNKNLSLYIVFWIVLTIINTFLFYYGLNIRFTTAILENFVFNFILCGLGLSYWYTASYSSFNDKNISKIILGHVLAGFITSGVWLAAGFYFITGVLNYKADFISHFQTTFLWRFAIGAMFYYLMISFYYIVIYYKNLQQKTTNEIELKNLVTEAEIKSLKFQINPHFIFNSLNSMSALTIINPERARDMILKLAEFLRFTLANNDKKTNSIGEELKNIKLYLEIEKIRFEDKFDYLENIQADCINVQIPTMILQPLFENAIKHAVYESLEKVTLKLSCKKNEEFLQISLENNFEPGNSCSKGTGIGLKNIKDRLEIIYGQPNLITVQTEGNIFRVKLFIPV
jgi:sensor histidine kinase YesM